MNFTLDETNYKAIIGSLQEKFPYLFFDTNERREHINIWTINRICLLDQIKFDQISTGFIVMGSGGSSKYTSANEIVEHLTVLIHASPKILPTYMRAEMSGIRGALKDIYTVISSAPGSPDYLEAYTRFKDFANI
nr:hypothetical protein K-LCC10_0187 [Kaumoebavirus]